MQPPDALRANLFVEQLSVATDYRQWVTPKDVPATAGLLELTSPTALVLRDVLSRVLRQDLVDEGLVAHAAAPRFLPKMFKHAGIDANDDELPRRVTERWTAHAAHRALARSPEYR